MKEDIRVSRIWVNEFHKSQMMLLSLFFFFFMEENTKHEKKI